MRSEWNEIDRTFAAFEQLRQRMETPFAAADSGPRFRVFEDDAAFRLEAELPGMSDKDIDVAMQGDVVTLRGLDAEKVEAVVANGVVTIRLPKAAAARPRRIPVRPGG